MSLNPLRRLVEAPAPVLVLGFGGLVPFFALAALALHGDAFFWLRWLAGYGAVIASFVGALQWGYAVADGEVGAHGWLRYGWSVLPSLIVWVALSLSVTTTLRIEAATLLACLIADFLLIRFQKLPPWWLPVRCLLSAGGAAALLIGAFADVS